MTPGNFHSQINKLQKLLKKIDVLDYRNYSPSYPSHPASIFRRKKYIDVWNECFRQQFYDFQLFDNSLIQFVVYSYKPLKLSYTYYECPYDCMHYDDFLVEHDFDLHEVGDALKPEYEQYLTTCACRSSFTPIRYDLAPDSYMEGLHPAAHIHVGFSNNIRLCTRKVLRPISFVLFVLRQCYPNLWPSFLTSENNLKLCSNVREALDDIDDKNWNQLDEKEMYLS